MGLLTPLQYASHAEFSAIQQATANKLIEVAMRQTGTTASDWIVRPFMPDTSATIPTGSSMATGGPDRTLSATFGISGADNLGWHWDISAANTIEMPSIATVGWQSAFLAADRTVPDQTFYGVFGWWEAAMHSRAVANTEQLHGDASSPMTAGWKFVSGAQTLDMWWCHDQMSSSEAVGGITNSPVIFTQNSNFNPQIWYNAEQIDGAGTDTDHGLGLFMLTCERAGENISGSGVHTVTPLPFYNGPELAKVQSDIASNLLNMATTTTGTSASDWVVRPFILSDNSTNTPLASVDLLADGTLYGAVGNASGWLADSSAVSTTAFTTVLSSGATIPDNKFMAFYGGFENPIAGLASATGVSSGMATHWLLQKGAGTEAIWQYQESFAWAEPWGFIANKPVYYEQNSSINIKILGNASAKNFFDVPVGLLGLTCEKLGENISGSKISN